MAAIQTELRDEDLVERAKTGDREAFARLVDRHRSLAYGFAYAYLRTREEAEDAAQEAFVRAFARLDRVRPGSPWGPYLMVVLRNVVRDSLRRRKVRQANPQSPPDACEDVLGRLVEEERSTTLRAAVLALPGKFRIPLLMHYGSGQTYKEIALALDMKESTVVGRLAGGLRCLRRKLAWRDEL